MEMSRLPREGTAETVSRDPNSQARTGTGKKTFSLFSWPRAGLATLPGWSKLLLYVMSIHTYTRCICHKIIICTWEYEANKCLFGLTPAPSVPMPWNAVLPSIFLFVATQRTRVQIWLYENTKMRIEGQILGFDEYMNLVLDEAEEVRWCSY